VQSSHPVEPARALLRCCSVSPAEPDVVTLSSSFTEEALELLFSGPPHNSVSRVSEPSCNSNSDQFDGWPEANDTSASVYVALTRDALSSRADISSSPQSRSQATLS
jgi:hypothetical protein